MLAYHLSLATLSPSDGFCIKKKGGDESLFTVPLNARVSKVTRQPQLINHNRSNWKDGRSRIEPTSAHIPS